MPPVKTPLLNETKLSDIAIADYSEQRSRPGLLSLNHGYRNISDI